MSTRCNIRLVDVVNKEEMWFYRHSDGYPEGTLPLLEVFIKWLKEDKIRNNLSQSAGWLIVLGAMEYNTIPNYKKQHPFRAGMKSYGDIATIESPDDWKVGAIEPTTGQHGDIGYLYTIDLNTKTLETVEI